MNILWLTWKDDKHPTAGGAEVVLRELSHRLVEEGHTVTWLTCGYGTATRIEHVDGLTIIRVGTNRYTHPLWALLHYVRRLRGKFDVVIEVVNTAPYFSTLFDKKTRHFLFYHQLAREVWFHEAGIPFSYVGYYVLEPLATRLLSRSNAPVITVSESTRQDLVRYGFKTERVHIITQGIQLEPVTQLDTIKKFAKPTILSLGAFRAMKRTRDQIVAFELAKQHIPDLQLKIAGSAQGVYGEAILAYIHESRFAADIEYVGRVTDEEKRTLMQRSHLITVTSIKEGWGLIVTEAASQGTPAIAYDVDGLRDSIRHRETGLLTATNADALSKGILAILSDKKAYNRLRQAAWQWSKEMTFDAAYHDLKTVMELA
jgi:glycosyltransferase involved in cell wall biosynthesis